MNDRIIADHAQNGNINNNFNSLRAFMSECGLPFPDIKEINLDGMVHRYSSRQNEEEDEWYIGSEVLAGKYTCTVSSWRQGDKFHWHSEGMSLDSSEYLKKREELLELAIEYEVNKREDGRKKAVTLWNNAVPCYKHAYLERKKLPCKNLKMTNGLLVIPLYDIEGKLGAVQLIDSSGKKKFPGMPMKGYFHVIGSLEGAAEAYLAEGYATALSVHLATGKPAIASFSAQLLCVVGKTIQTKYSGIDLFLAADNDEMAGKKAAKEWIEYISSYVVFPKKHKDFNDVWVFEGKEETAKQLEVQKPLEFPNRDIKSFLMEKHPPIIKVNHFLNEGSFNIIYGVAGVGKSRLAYELAASLALKVKFMDYFDTYLRKKVLYIDCELPPNQVQERFKSTLEKHGKKDLPEEHLYILDKESIHKELEGYLDLYNPHHVLRLFPFIEKFDVIFFDNFNNMHVAPEGDSYRPDKGKWQLLFHHFYKSKIKNKVIVMIMHSTKSGNLEGVQQIKNDADVILRFEKPEMIDKGKLLQCTLFYEKVRDLPAYEQVPKKITLDKAGWLVTDYQYPVKKNLDKDFK